MHRARLQLSPAPSARIAPTLFALLALLTPLPRASAADEPRLAREGRDAILGALETVPAPGVPGRIAVFGPLAFPVLALERDGAPRTVIAAAQVPRGGRVVAFAHDGYLSAGALARPDGGALLTQALAWAAGGLKLRERDRVFLIGADDLAGPLAELGYEVETRARVDDEPQLAILGRVDLDDEEVEVLWELLDRDGGLLCAATGWGWEQLNAGRDIAVDLPLNRLLQRVGLAFTGGTVDGRDGAFRVADGRGPAAAPTAHAGRLLDALLAGELEGDAARAARGALIDAATAVPEDEPTFGARLRGLVEDRRRDWQRGRAHPLSPDPRDALAVALESRRLERTPPAELTAVPGVEAFPGVARTAKGREPGGERLERVVPPGPRGRRSLGVWVPAGRAVEVAVDPPVAGARWRLGAHSDGLWAKERWERWPEVSRTFPADATTIATPFGGLLYLELDAPNRTSLAVTVDGGLAAPVLGAGADATDRAAFEAALERYDPTGLAPWVELVGRHVVLTVPFDAARACADPAAVIDYWDRTWLAHVDLLGRPIADRPERFVFDVQISAGWMHSGYPIMAHLPSARPALDVAALGASGDWGLFHELGHNAQEREWTSSNMGEVTCNLFALHAMEALAGIPVAEHERGGGLLEWLDGHRARVAAGEAGFEELRRDPFHMLSPFVELQLAFGWEPFTTFFDEHRRARDGQDPRGLGAPAGPDRDGAVRDQWAERFSRLVGRDVSGFLTSCGWPISPAVRARLSDLEPWSPDA